LRAYVVVDLGFGDAGKGLLTDFLVRRTGAGLVVRYNGGAQAGHNVVAPDGRHHTFSQFGSGTFVPGVRTFLSRHVVVHPAALLAEGDLLQEQGVRDVYARLRVSARAPVITPFHQAANRLRELARGADRHGSCGVGVGETVEDARAHPEERLLAGDLLHPDELRRKLRRIRERKRQELAPLAAQAGPASRSALEWGLFERDGVAEEWIASIARLGALGLVAPDDLLGRWLDEAQTAVFEGAQGVLLDADAGFHPYTTWSRCTADNALELLAEQAPGAQVRKVGVLRAYAVRHGPGPLPTETGELETVVAEHNRAGDWQGPVRYGWFDAVLVRYALAVAGGVDRLVLTHLDVPPRLGSWRVCPGYRGEALAQAPVERQIAAGLLTGFRTAPGLPLVQREHLTRALLRVEPALEACGTEAPALAAKVAALLGRPVDALARGPAAADVETLTADL